MQIVDSRIPSNEVDQASGKASGAGAQNRKHSLDGRDALVYEAKRDRPPDSPHSSSACKELPAMADESTIQMNIRMPIDLMNKLEAHVAKLQAAMPGVRMTVSDVVRNLLSKALEAEASGADRESAAA